MQSEPRHAPDWIVVPVPKSEGERFIVLETKTFVSELLQSCWSKDSDDWRDPQHWLRTASSSLVTESEARARLEGRGVPADEIDRCFVRARQFKAWTGEASFVRLTRIGFRNERDQEVVRKTDRAGTDAGQRVFVMRCGECRHEYGTNGSDISHRRCPRCQDGAPGLPFSPIHA